MKRKDWEEWSIYMRPSSLGPTLPLGRFYKTTDPPNNSILLIAGGIFSEPSLFPCENELNVFNLMDVQSR